MKFLKLALVSVLLAVSGFAQALDLTDYAENKIVDSVFRGQALGAPTTWYLGLDTAACGDTGGGTEVSGGSYSRVAVTAGLAEWAGTQAAASTGASTGTGGTTSNNSAITFPTPTAGWGTLVSVRWHDALTGGNSWICTPLTISKTVNIGDTVSFPASSLTFQIDN